MLLNKFQINQGLGGYHPVDGADLRVEQVEQIAVVLADHFDDRVEGACGEDDGDLLDLLNTKIRAVDGVISTETLVYLKLVKQQYNWGTR